MRTRILTHVLVHRGQALCDSFNLMLFQPGHLSTRLQEKHVQQKGGRPATLPHACIHDIATSKTCEDDCPDIKHMPVRTQQTPSEANMSQAHCPMCFTQGRWASPISYTTAFQRVQHVVERSLFLGRLVGFGQQRDKLLNRAAGFEHMFYSREHT